MAEKTYNTGRVVGWSTYEEFLKETGTDPNSITNYIYNTLVTYGVTRRVELQASEGAWKLSHGGKFYTQTIRVKGASWGAVPIVGLDYESYMDVFSNPTNSNTNVEQLDESEKLALEEAVGNIFTVYVSDANGNKATSSVADHGYLTFVAYPDILKFTDDIQNIAGGTMKLIVRGLSLEDLDVSTLYFGPQGFVFAGNGLIEDCYHRTENINNLMVQASDYVTFAITGSAASSGGGYLMYNDIAVQIEGVVSGYLDIDRLQKENYLLNDIEIDNFITSAASIGSTVTKDFYDKIPNDEKSDYVYMIYGSRSYTDVPPASAPLYILAIRKSDGYTGFGVQLDHDHRAKVGYSSTSTTNPPVRSLNLMYTKRTGPDKVLILKDKNMPDYIGCYWSHDEGWYGEVEYTQQNGQSTISWETLKNQYGAVFHDEGRNSYIVCETPQVGTNLVMGKSILIYGGSYEDGEDSTSIQGFYLCTESPATDSSFTKLILSRRGGCIITKPDEGKPNETWIKEHKYYHLTSAHLESGVDSMNEKYLVAKYSKHADPQDTSTFVNLCQSRIYRGELIYILYSGDEFKQSVISLFDSNNQPNLVLYSYPAIILDSASTDLSNYTGSLIESSFTNAIAFNSKNSFYGSLPTSIYVMNNEYDENTVGNFLTVSWNSTADKLTTGTLVKLEHSVANVFGNDCNYLYQYIGEESHKSILVSSVSQKGGTTFYSLAGLTSHLNSGFPRSKKNLPIGDKWWYDYPKAITQLRVEDFFNDFGLDITKYLHPDFRNTSLLKFIQNLASYEHLGKPASAVNKRSLGFGADYTFFNRSDILVGETTNMKRPTIDNPITASLELSARTDPTSFNSPGFFSAHYLNTESDATFNLANPDYPIWATIAKSRNGEQVMSVSLIDDEGRRLNISGSEGTIETDTVVPHDLLVAMALGKSVDNLKGMRVNRTSTNGNYLLTADGTRLYIATNEPTATDDNPIPDGSIGIGW